LNSGNKQGIFSFSEKAESRPGPDPTSLLWHSWFVSGVKRPGRRENSHCLPSANVKNQWSYTPAPPICLHCVKRNKL